MVAADRDVLPEGRRGTEEVAFAVPGRRGPALRRGAGRGRRLLQRLVPAVPPPYPERAGCCRDRRRAGLDRRDGPPLASPAAPLPISPPAPRGRHGDGASPHARPRGPAHLVR